MDRKSELDEISVEDAVLYLAYQYAGELDLEKINPNYLSEDGKLFLDKIKSMTDKALLLLKEEGLFQLVKRVEASPVALEPGMWDFYIPELETAYKVKQARLILKDLARSKNPIEALRLAQEKIKDLELESSDLQDFTSKGFAHRFLDLLEAKKGETTPELETGLKGLDLALWGLHRGEIITVGARPGVGKSAFSLNLAAHLLQKKKKVLYFSTEMSAYEQWARLMSIMSGVPAFQFRKAVFDPREMKEIIKAVEQLYESDNFTLCDAPSPPIHQIKALVKKHHPDVVILDYLQRFTFEDEDRLDLAIGGFMKSVKTLAREQNVAILLPSQLNRNVEARQSRVPSLSDLRESGSIEQESDIVLMLYPDQRDGGDIPSERLFCLVEKNRHGPCKTIELYFKKEYQRISEVYLGE